MTIPWLQAGHIIFAIFWMAGLFMLPRYFVYHQEAAFGSAEDTRWVERETRLRRIILTPSLIIVWVLGLALAHVSGAFSQGWFHAKLLILLLLSAYHGFLASYARRLADGERRLSGKSLRLLNEVPGMAVALIVVLAVVRPF
ncbi:MAG: CopD family protein [Novosphingobium sp.]|nr:CopD family protein [Novosphingobium sp.]